MPRFNEQKILRLAEQLQNAITTENRELVTTIIEDAGSDAHLVIGCTNYQDNNSLHLAATVNNIDIAKILVNKASDGKGQLTTARWNDLQNTPLRIAFMQNNTEMAKLFLSTVGDKNAQWQLIIARDETKGRSLLHSIAAHCDQEMIKFLIDEFGQERVLTALNSKLAGSNSTPVHIALSENNINILVCFIKLLGNEIYDVIDINRLSGNAKRNFDKALNLALKSLLDQLVLGENLNEVQSALFLQHKGTVAEIILDEKNNYGANIDFLAAASDDSSPLGAMLAEAELVYLLDQLSPPESADDAGAGSSASSGEVRADAAPFDTASNSKLPKGVTFCTQMIDGNPIAVTIVKPVMNANKHGAMFRDVATPCAAAEEEPQINESNSGAPGFACSQTKKGNS